LQDRSNWGDLLKDESHPFINRAFMSRYPPGSVFKIVTLFAALEAGFASERTTFFCSGTYEVGNRIFRCWKRSGHGQIDLLRAVAESCDVFFYQLGQKVGIERIIGAAKKLGMVDKTGIDLPGEISSVIPGAAWKQEHYGSPWYAGDTVNAAVGQGFINVTPLSIAVLTAAVANQGKIVTPHVVKEVKGASRAPIPTRLETEKVRPLQAKASTWDIIRTGMRAAVASPTGTAHVADLSSVAVAGKTGSAQTKPGTPTHAWFVCFAPYENPEVVCVVVVEQGGYGGEMAAPIARQVLEAYFSRGRTANNSPQTNEGKGPSPLPAVVKPPASLKGNGNSR
jgi:penicillin-binding protein 2